MKKKIKKCDSRLVQTQQFISLLVQVAVVSLPCDDFKAAWLSIPSLQELNSRSSGRLLKLLCMAASPSSLTSGLSVYCWLSWWPRAEYPTQVVTSHLMLCLVLIMLLHSRCKMSGKKPLISDKPGAALVWPLLSGISTTHWQDAIIWLTSPPSGTIWLMCLFSFQHKPVGVTDPPQQHIPL